MKRNRLGSAVRSVANRAAATLSRLLLTLLVCTMPACGAAKHAQPKAAAVNQWTAALPADVQAEATRAWTAVRRRHPLHFQALFTSPAPGGHVVVIVTEPPPHATAVRVGELLDAKSMQVKESRIGFDGWARDLVLVLDASSGFGRSEEQRRERLAALARYLFFSTYRTPVYDAFAPAERALDATLDLELPLGSIHEWLLERGRRFQRVDGGEVAASALFTSATPGVYRAEDIGLAAWVIPARDDLCAHRAFARQFAVETDLILGGARRDDRVVILGRERAASQQYVPPLRTEDLLVLAAADAPQLGQSFQRTNLLAGKLRNARDWAPIMLSPELVDTEFGSLLNVTDQLLKSWSLNGMVTYENFSYPRPQDWPAVKPLNEELANGASSFAVTFNWNTSGAFSNVTWRGLEAVVLSRSGALPIAYFPEGSNATDVSAYEERNQNYFAAKADPNLVRVVGYTTFYHAARVFGLRSDLACMPTRAALHRARPRETEAERFLQGLARALLEGRAAPHVSAPKNPIQLDAAQKTQAKLAEARQVLGPQGVEELVHYLGGVSGPGTVAYPNQSVIDVAAELAGNLHAAAIYEDLVDRDAVLAEYTRLAARNHTSWVGTPSVVLSNIAERVHREVRDGRVYVVTHRASGGHNLRMVPGSVRITQSQAEPMVRAARRFEFEAELDERYLRLHPRQFRHIQKRVQNGLITGDAAQTDLDQALSLSPTAPPVLPISRLVDPSGVGYRTPRGSPSRPADERVFHVRWLGQPDRVYEGWGPAGRLSNAETTAGVFDALRRQILEHTGRTPREPFLLRLQDFPSRRQPEFVRTIADYLYRSESGPRVLFVIPSGTRAGVLKTLLRRFSGDARVSELPVVQLADGSFEYSLEVRKAGLVLRVKSWLMRRSPEWLTSFKLWLTQLFRRSNERDVIRALENFSREQQQAISAELQQDESSPPGGPTTPQIPPEPQVQLPAVAPRLAVGR